MKKGKLNKIMAGIGLTTVLGGCMIGATGCADMTDSQIQEALDTAIEANETLKDMVESLEKQNADYIAQNEKYQQLLEEKNKIIEKIANDKSRNLPAEEAVKLLTIAQMDFKLMSSVTNNISVRLQGNDGKLATIDVYKKADDTHVYRTSQTYESDGQNYVSCYYGYGNAYTDNSFILYSETKDANDIVTEKGKSVYDENIHSFLSTNLNPLGTIDVQASDIFQSEVLEDGTFRIVAFVIDEDSYHNTKKMYNILLDKDGKFLSIERNYLRTSLTNNNTTYLEYVIGSWTYGELTEDWANETINLVDSYEEPTE